MIEHRKFIRLAWKAKVKALTGGQIKATVTDGNLKNIAKNGFAFSSEDVLHVGKLYDFQIGDIQDLPIYLQGIVIRSRSFDTYFHYGVKITSIHLMDRIRLNQFLIARDSALKLRFFIYSLLLGAVVGAAGHFLFGLSQGICFGLVFATTLIHIFFPPF